MTAILDPLSPAVDPEIRSTIFDTYIPENPPLPKHSHHPGMVAYVLLAASVCLAFAGVVALWQEQRQISFAQCNRVNVIRAKLAGTVIAAEQNTPAERYTPETKKLFDDALADFALTDCNSPKNDVHPVFPERPPRAPGEAPKPIILQDGSPGAPGAAGLAGAPGLQGLQGIPGIPGLNGAPGKDGEPGPRGPAGVAGPAGPVGPAGPAGPVGPAGPQGPPAPTVPPTTTPPTTAPPPPLPPPTTAPPTTVAPTTTTTRPCGGLLQPPCQSRRP